MLAISGYGSYLLRTEQDLSWFLPTDSYFTKFLQTQETYFNEGKIANLYIGVLSYDHLNMFHAMCSLTANEISQIKTIDNFSDTRRCKIENLIYL